MIFVTLDDLESISSTNAKIEILKAGMTPELRELLDLALNFKIKFGVKQFDDYLNTPEGPGMSHPQFVALAQKLASRQITGDLARQAIDDFFLSCANDQRKWYGRVLRKDLRSGTDIDLCNKAGYNFPVFEVALAKDAKKVKNLAQVLVKGGYISPKLDGYRCLAVIDNGDVKLYSRNGKEYENFPTIVAELSRVFHDQRIVLDGECMSDTFQAIQKTALSCKSKASVGDIVYHIFDVIPFMEWTSQKFEMQRQHRMEWLKLLELDKNSTLLKEVPQAYINNLADALKLERDYIAIGLEGAIFAPDKQPYYVGRKTGGLLKFKTMLSMDADIVGYKEGLGKYQGMLGALIVRQDNQLLCEVGTGFSDEERLHIWQRQSEFLGVKVEVKYQELSTDGICRFPVKMRFRLDK